MLDHNLKNLAIILANYSYLSMKTQNYHWNVTGHNFTTLHSMFEIQYKDSIGAMDLIAERIRALGAKTPATLAAYAKLVIMNEGDEQYSAIEMIKDLIDSHLTLVKLLKAGVVSATQADDPVTEGMLINRIEEHEKAIWILTSSL